MTLTTTNNEIRESLYSGKFLYTLEHVPARCSQPDQRGFAFLAAEAASVARDERVVGVNIGDRVKSMQSLSTVDCGVVAAEHSGKMPLLHLAGKDRTPEQARSVFYDAFNKGLDTFLLVTGDGVPTPEGCSPTGGIDTPEQAAASTRTRYVDSVNAIVMAKEMNPRCLVAAGVAPFKYREEELMNQYLKMVKKIHAGADYLVTNCGWDMDKYQELIWYRDARGFTIPIVANLLLPALGWAKAIHERRLPGVFMSDELFALLEQEKDLDKEERVSRQVRRLALQVIGVQRMGYAGVQISGIETHAELSRVIDTVEDLQYQYPTLDAWKTAWSNAHPGRDDSPLVFGPSDGLYLFGSTPPAGNSLDGPPTIGSVQPDRSEMRKFRVLDLVDRAFFHPGTPGASLVGGTLRGIDHLPGGSTFITHAEHQVKKSLLGCEMCGFCRIPYMFYVCPETCPKGLANGPCAGTDGNACEFKDRECVHNRKYRIAKQMGRLQELEVIHVPGVENSRGSSSWLNLYRGNIPSVGDLGDRDQTTEESKADESPPSSEPRKTPG